MKNILPLSTLQCFVGSEGKPLSPMVVRDLEVCYATTLNKDRNIRLHKIEEKMEKVKYSVSCENMGSLFHKWGFKLPLQSSSNSSPFLLFSHSSLLYAALFSPNPISPILSPLLTRHRQILSPLHHCPIPPPPQRLFP